MSQHIHCVAVTCSERALGVGFFRAKELTHRIAAAASACVGVRRSMVIQCYFADLTPAELTGSNYHLVRAFGTMLQPHLYDWDCWRVANPRLFRSPVVSGRRSRALTEDELNFLPNPYAVMDQFG